MTTLDLEQVRCGVCGVESEYECIGSTNSFGSSDLDTRPPEMARSTMFAWVQRCPNCGYCASDVSKARPEAGTVVKGKKYTKQLNERLFPELANSFLCEAMVREKCSEFAAATWATIRAAWACDDSGDLDEANKCRRQAVKMLAAAEEHGQRLSDEEGGDTAILVDLLRRSGEIGQARKVIEARRSGIPDGVIARVLDYHAALLDKNDVCCHTIAEALGDGS